MEHWTSSPAEEQADPVGSASRAADIAHDPSNPHKFAYNSDGLFLIDNRQNPPIEWYKQYDYAKFDHLWMQLQNSNRFTVADMINVADEARIKNPSIVIFAQLSLVFDDVPYDNQQDSGDQRRDGWRDLLFHERPEQVPTLHD